MTQEFQPIHGFDKIGANEPLKWFCPPDGWPSKDDDDDDNDDREGKDGWWKVEDQKLLLAPPAKKDFWRKTYYEPVLLVKDDGPFLYTTIQESHLPVTIETSFSLTAKNQFDQAGILIRLDHEHWIKTGIEVVDGTPRLSCVVTNGFSDWSTQTWHEAAIKIRVHILPQRGGSFVVEAAPIDGEEQSWSFLRIAHMHRGMNHDLMNDDAAVTGAFQGESAPPGCLMVGVFSACPMDQTGTVATFHNLSIVKGSAFVHDLS